MNPTGLLCMRCTNAGKTARWLDLTAELLLCDDCADHATGTGHQVRHTVTGHPHRKEHP